MYVLTSGLKYFSTRCFLLWCSLIVTFLLDLFLSFLFLNIDFFLARYFPIELWLWEGFLDSYYIYDGLKGFSKLDKNMFEFWVFGISLWAIYYIYRFGLLLGFRESKFYRDFLKSVISFKQILLLYFFGFCCSKVYKSAALWDFFKEFLNTFSSSS